MVSLHRPPRNRTLEGGLGWTEKVRKSQKLRHKVGAENRARASGWLGSKEDAEEATGRGAGRMAQTVHPGSRIHKQNEIRAATECIAKLETVI